MISVIIPTLNEEKSVAILHAELKSVLTSVGMPYEIIFVDDGSTDGTVAEIKKLKPVRLIVFAKNFGKSKALQAGFQAAVGDYIFTMDSDLQDDPKEIPHFLEAMQKNSFDLVCGWKKYRYDSFAKRMVSKVANGLARSFTGITVHDMNCCFKLYRKEVAKAINLYGDMHRYIPILVAAQGFSIGEIPVLHRERKFGTSKYGNLRRLSKSSFDFITLLLIRRFVDRPMHFFGIVGALLLAIGGVILGYLSYIKIFEGALIGNRPALLLGVLLVLMGVQLFSSGFLGELLIRQKDRRALYTIREEIKQ